MKIYIAGKVTGNSNYVVQFFTAAAFYQSQGHIVLNPAALPERLGDAAAYMRLCLPMLMSADCVVLLPNWRFSGGAKVERELAVYLGMKTVYAENDPHFMQHWRQTCEP